MLILSVDLSLTLIVMSTSILEFDSTWKPYLIHRIIHDGITPDHTANPLVSDPFLINLHRDISGVGEILIIQ